MIRPGVLLSSRVENVPRQWLVLSNAAGDTPSVICCTIKPLNDWSEQACILPGGAHAWFDRDMAIHYHIPKQWIGVKQLEVAINRRSMTRDVLDAHWFQQVLDGIARTRRLPDSKVNELVRQGLIAE